MNNNITEYFNEFSKGIKSKRTYSKVLDELGAFCECDLLEVTPSMIEGYLDSLDNNNNTKKRKYHQLLSFYNYLFDRMLIEKNPVRSVPVPKASKQIKIDRTISFDNVFRLLELLKSSYAFRDYLITLIIATTGMKLSEVTSLSWDDFFVDSSENIGVMVGSDENNRYVRIFDFVWDEINDYRESLGVTEDFMKSGHYLFFAENQKANYLSNPALVKPISTGWIKKVHTKACEELNIPLVTSKDIRHSYTMLCIKLGSPGEEIKDQLGWSSTQFLFRYNGVIEMLDSPINNMVEEYFKGAGLN